MRNLVHLAKLRGRVERSYQQMMGELGLGHHDARDWLGFRHHAASCAANGADPRYVIVIEQYS